MCSGAVTHPPMRVQGTIAKAAVSLLKDYCVGAGGLQMILANLVLAVVLAREFGKYGVDLPTQDSVGVVVVLCVFIAGFAWSACLLVQGPACEHPVRPHCWLCLAPPLSKASLWVLWEFSLPALPGECALTWRWGPACGDMTCFQGLRGCS